jgi:hypothetical protein
VCRGQGKHSQSQLLSHDQKNGQHTPTATHTLLADLNTGWMCAENRGGTQSQPSIYTLLADLNTGWMCAENIRGAQSQPLIYTLLADLNTGWVCAENRGGAQSQPLIYTLLADLNTGWMCAENRGGAQSQPLSQGQGTPRAHPAAPAARALAAELLPWTAAVLQLLQVCVCVCVFVCFRSRPCIFCNLIGMCSAAVATCMRRLHP